MDFIKKSSFLIYLGCFYSTILSGNPQTTEHEKLADRLFSEGFFHDSAFHFEELIQLEKPDPSVYLKLAAAYLEMGKTEKVLALLTPLDPFQNRQAESERLYLISLAYRRLGQHEAILHLIQTAEPTRLLSLEKGIALYHLKSFSQAEAELTKIEKKQEDDQIYNQAQLYLIRLAIENKESAKAKILLQKQTQTTFETAFLEGMSHYLDHDYANAALSLEKALRNKNLVRDEGTVSILTYLTECYLNLALGPDPDPFFRKADDTLQKLLLLDQSEKTFLLKADRYFLEAQLFHDQAAYQKALEILNEPNRIISSEGKKHLLLKQAIAAPTYKERTALFSRLKENADPTIWFQIGMNDYQEALYHNRPQNEKQLFEQAAFAFDQAFTLSSPQGASAELYDMLGEITLLSPDYGIPAETISRLIQGSQLYPQNASLKIVLGKLYLQQKNWKEADSTLASLPDHPEALFWRAKGALEAGDSVSARKFFELIYTQHPDSSFAPAAYFHCYTFREYLRGQRKAIKHLQMLPVLYPHHPLAISAYYLMGLDHKKNHLSEEGKIIRRKDDIAAIDAFNLAESTFDQQMAKEIIPESDKSYYMQIRYLAILERALANFSIAQSSEGGKKLIYLEYSEKVFKDLMDEFQKPSQNLSKYLIRNDPYPKIWEEAEFGLAQVYLAKNKRNEANQVFDRMITHFSEAGIKQSYLLSRAWYEKGLIAKENQDEKLALTFFVKSEEAVKGHPFLSPDEKLDLWIQQSLCYKALHQLNDAMKLLSRVVNDETISHLRVKAMYLRADLYALEGRKELALKQLIATSKKGGEWGKKAKEQLEAYHANE